MQKILEQPRGAQIMRSVINLMASGLPVVIVCARCGDAMDETCEPDNCKDPECPILYGEKK